ncbi:Fc.00g083200.m01.CDS01 [Cosmosporella sp. VM-42]
MEHSQLHQRRRQQRKACDLCRRRKVRCDIVVRPGGPCSICEKSGLECRLTAKWANPRPRSAAQQTRDQNNEELSPLQANNHPGREEQDKDHGANSPSQTRAAALLLQSMQGNAAENHASISSGQEQLARQGLARFFKHGIGAAVWAVFTSTSFRIAYVGTGVSNLVHLVNLHRSFRQPYAIIGDRHRPPSASTAPETSADGPGPEGSVGSNKEASAISLHYPYPPIRPSKPWKPRADLWGIASTEDLALEVASFPELEVRNALIQAYFEHVHPYFPIMSMPEFLESYRTPEKPPPLLLFQAVLMAGAHVCSHPRVAADRHAVKNILFRRASMLYHMRHETDRIHLMQAAVLFTWHVGDGDTVSGGPWYWAGIAVRVGCGLGAHRRTAHLPALEKSQYLRSWWVAFVCEVFSSLETGRPCAIRAEDIDQLPLSEDDMTDTCVTSTQSTGEEARPDYFNRLVELAYIGLEILALNAPSQERSVDINSINTRLGIWSLRSGLSSVADRDGSSTCHLRMHYNLVLLHLHRNLSIVPTSRSICSTAAQAIVTSLEQLASRDKLRQCQFTAVSAITAAGIQFANEIREAVIAREFLVSIQALERLARLLRSATMLALYWPNADAVHSVFEELHLEYESFVTQHLQGEQVIIPESPDWNRLLAGEPVRQLNGFTTDQEWMNISNWDDLL